MSRGSVRKVAAARPLRLARRLAPNCRFLLVKDATGVDGGAEHIRFHLYTTRVYKLRARPSWRQRDRSRFIGEDQDMWWDDEFNLREHGDRYERLWWHLLSIDFPEWEKFWVHHVVPLTNRIDDRLKDDNPRKLFFRQDNKIDKDVESLIMRNYTIFYYLARASVVVLNEPHLFPEDAFFYLRAVTENVEKFIGKLKGPLRTSLKLDLTGLPDWEKIEDVYPANAIKDYREAFIHEPRLGRSPHLEWEFIPKYSILPKARSSWSYVQKLPKHDFEDGRLYLQKVRVDLMKVLNPIWEKANKALDARRNTDEYLRLYRIDPKGKILS